MLLAIPISLAGVRTVNDIRNRAAEDILLDFDTDFSSPTAQSVYPGTPYTLEVSLTGDLAPIATVSLGCDTNTCSDVCDGAEHNPPEGLQFNSETNTLFWNRQAVQRIGESWNVTLSATAPSPDNPDNTICVLKTLTLMYQERTENVPPTCTLFLPGKHSTITAGSSTPLKLEARDTDGGISKAVLTVSDENGILEEREWEDETAPQTLFLSKESDPELSFTPQTPGTFYYSAEVTDNEGTSTLCSTEGGSDGPEINIVIPGENGSPVYKTDPYTQSSPGTSLNIGQSYTYIVEAEDPNGDSMDYFIVNNTGWLTFTVNSNEPGKFKGTFTGTPTAAGSYTAGIALHDGAHNHYSTQLWVINVNYPENDVPSVKVTLPPVGTSVEHGQTMRIEWEATDRNLITKFDVYLSTDPQNASASIPLSLGLGYNYNAYLWNVGSTPPGYYYIIVKATDNQTPPATGAGISAAFGISVPAEGVPPVQPVVTGHPTISNLRPGDRSEIEETNPFISADLSAADNATVKKDSIVVRVDDIDVTDLISTEGEDQQTASFMYKPEEPLGLGTHRINVTFEDSSNQTASKSWTFTIVVGEEEEEEEEEPADTISLFGFEIPRRIAVIIGIGIVLLIIALAIPWLFYAAWKGPKEEELPFEPYTPPAPRATGSSILQVKPPIYGNVSGVPGQPVHPTFSQESLSSSHPGSTSLPSEKPSTVPFTDHTITRKENSPVGLPSFRSSGFEERIDSSPIHSESSSPAPFQPPQTPPTNKETNWAQDRTENTAEAQDMQDSADNTEVVETEEDDAYQKLQEALKNISQEEQESSLLPENQENAPPVEPPTSAIQGEKATDNAPPSGIQNENPTSPPTDTPTTTTATQEPQLKPFKPPLTPSDLSR